jgi:hypothetical protein
LSEGKMLGRYWIGDVISHAAGRAGDVRCRDSTASTEC